MSEKTIRIVEHPGYVETEDDIYNIDPGIYMFIIENRTAKTSEFVLLQNNCIPEFIRVKSGETAKSEVELTSGCYEFFCPIIPTPTYRMRVK